MAFWQIFLLTVAGIIAIRAIIMGVADEVESRQITRQLAEQSWRSWEPATYQSTSGPILELTAPKYSGSTTSIILGVIYFLAAISNLSKGQDLSGLEGGPIMILAGLACRSAKYRNHTELRRPKIRMGLEFIAMSAILFLWLARPDLKVQIANGNLAVTIVPVWAVVAYGVAFFKRPA